MLEINNTAQSVETLVHHQGRLGWHAGLWLRLFACTWDLILLLSIAQGLLWLFEFDLSPQESPTGLLIAALVAYLGSLAYFTFSEASILGATPGKLLMGICAIDYNENNLSLQQSIKRNFLKSSWLFALVLGVGLLNLHLENTQSTETVPTTIIYLTTIVACALLVTSNMMIFLTETQQALYDSWAHCFVVKRIGISLIRKAIFGALASLFWLALLLDNLPSKQPPANQQIAPNTPNATMPITGSLPQINLPDVASNQPTPEGELTDIASVEPTFTNPLAEASSAIHQSSLSNEPKTNSKLHSAPPAEPDRLPVHHFNARVFVDDTKYTATSFEFLARNNELQIKLFGGTGVEMATIELALNITNSTCGLAELNFYTADINPFLLGYKQDTQVQFVRSMRSLGNSDISRLKCRRNDDRNFSVALAGKGILRKNDSSSSNIYWDIDLEMGDQPKSSSAQNRRN